MTPAPKLLLAVLTPLLIAAGLYATAQPASATAYAGSGWTAISAGESTTCGIRTGRLYCWKTDGTGSSLYSISSATDWRSVSVGRSHQCAIRGTGVLYCWGDDTHGQVGNGGTAGNPSRPVRVAGTATSWKSVSAGGRHTCGVLGVGYLYCWGDDTNGQLGNSGGGNSDAPVRVAGTAKSWKSVSAGGTHTCGIRGVGYLFCWGDDGSGQLGNGSSAGSTVSPGASANKASTWRSVSAGDTHTCGTAGNGLAMCWGSDERGQLGNGSGTSGQSPRAINSSYRDWKNLRTDGAHTCGVRGAGYLYCWGDNTYRQVSGTTNPVQSPRWYGTARDWEATDTGARFSCGIRGAGSLACWGAQRPPSSGTPAGTGYPAQIDDLENLRKWKLTTPVDANKDGKPDEIKQPTLATYRSLNHFHTNSNNTAAVFRANAGGVTTSGSRYARSELREMSPSPYDEAAWSNVSGTHTMTIRAAITHLPVVKPHMVFAQIHDPYNEILLLRLDGNRLYTRVRTYAGTETEVVLNGNYRLGTPFTVRVVAKSSRIYVYYNDLSTPKASFSMRAARADWYFKAGAYCQSSSTKNTGSYVGESPYAYAESVISQLTVTHT